MISRKAPLRVSDNLSVVEQSIQGHTRDPRIDIDIDTDMDIHSLVYLKRTVRGSYGNGASVISTDLKGAH